ncbi:MAG: glycosyltransferase family 92 protein [Acidobacteriaceae bacterium]
MGLYFTVREKLRFNPAVNAAIYLTQSLVRSNFGRLVKDVRRADRRMAGAGVALCMRFRDEARYLAEWIEYYLAAGVDHFFLYNNFSTDDYASVLQPWIETGQVTLIDWPKVPASPGAEEDCIRRSLGRFRWVGVLDADEFVVLRDGSSIGEFLDRFPHAPGVALHWRFFGSSMHRIRPAAPVILAYQHRSPAPNAHVKTFVRPERTAQSRNPHSWFYYPIGTAVDEHSHPVYGSLGAPTADLAWINHYFCKSEEDYLEKTSRKPTSDQVTMRFQHRRPERVAQEFPKNNEVLDTCAVDYYRARCETLGRTPVLLNGTAISVFEG